MLFLIVLGCAWKVNAWLKTSQDQQDEAALSVASLAGSNAVLS